MPDTLTAEQHVKEISWIPFNDLAGEYLIGLDREDRHAIEALAGDMIPARGLFAPHDVTQDGWVLANKAVAVHGAGKNRWIQWEYLYKLPGTCRVQAFTKGLTVPA